MFCTRDAWVCLVCLLLCKEKGSSPSLSSCHQTAVFHFSTQDFAVSLNFERPSKVHGRARRVHCSMCAVFSVARPHSHVVSPSKYFHFFHCFLLHV